jgi:3-methyl-2-oxobutanoate hydroxymethyltransferase
MPFLSYQVSPEEAVRNAGRLIKEGGAHAVKLEGGTDMADTLRAIVRADIAVMGHIGLTPQAVHQLGGFRTQARDEAGRKLLLADAKAVEAAGAFAVVLEKVPDEAAGMVTRRLSIPTISCGAGPRCDGQVLVTYDLLGLFTDFTPSFAKRYAELGKAAVEAMSAFAEDVKKGVFPAPAPEKKSVNRRRKP